MRFCYVLEKFNQWQDLYCMWTEIGLMQCVMMCAYLHIHYIYLHIVLQFLNDFTIDYVLVYGIVYGRLGIIWTDY